MPSSATPGPGGRPGTTLAAFVVGLPLAVAVLGTIHYGPWQDPTVQRYVARPVEWVEVALCCCALGTLAAKLRQNLAERRACRALSLPAWDGKPVPVGDAAKLAGCLGGLSQRLRRTFLVRRVLALLDFLAQRRSTSGLDDQLRSLTDTDALTLENSYALTRFITWAIPILGFLGTVLGISGAIAGIKVEVLEKSLSGVTDGLAEAFDCTALALSLTMLTMFCSYLVERAEQTVLDAVDQYVEAQLAHRFQRSDAGTVAASPAQQELVEMTEQLVRRQAELWAQTFAEKERQSAELHARQQDRLAAALESALERTLQTHSQRLASLENHAVEQSAGLLEQMAALAAAVRDTAREQQAALTHVGEMMAAQAATLAQLQADERQLNQLQTALHQNLTALAGAGAFEQAVHNLTAAVHLLTSRTLPLQVQAPLGPRGSTGKAA